MYWVMKIISPHRQPVRHAKTPNPRTLQLMKKKKNKPAGSQKLVGSRAQRLFRPPHSRQVLRFPGSILSSLLKDPSSFMRFFARKDCRGNNLAFGHHSRRRPKEENFFELSADCLYSYIECSLDKLDHTL